MSHHIDHAELKKAAAQMLDICGAGYREQLQSRYWERFHDLPIHQRQNSARDPMYWAQLNWDAELLANLTDAPLHQCKSAIREAAGDLCRREIGLELLREMSAQVRRLEHQA